MPPLIEALVWPQSPWTDKETFDTEEVQLDSCHMN